MKKIINIITFIFTFFFIQDAFSNSEVSIDGLLKKAKSRKLNKSMKKEFKKYLGLYGKELLLGSNTRQLQNIDLSESFFYLAKNKFDYKAYKSSNKLIEKIPVNSKVYAEAMLLKGTNYYFLKNNDMAHSTFNKCIYLSEVKKELFDKNTNFNYRSIKDKCHIMKARVYFENGKSKKALNEYEKVSKYSLYWPKTIVERSWIHFVKGDFNRSLGLISTLDAPFLKSYRPLESDLLKSLNYTGLCLYQDALKTIDSFSTIYKENKKSIDQFILLEDMKNHIQRRKIDRIISLIENVDGSSNTISTLKKYKKYSKEKYQNEILSSLKSAHREIQKTKLFVLDSKKTLLYKNETLISQEARGDISNVKIKSNELFFSFKREFWLDELGDYSFGLKSNCEVMKES